MTDEKTEIAEDGESEIGAKVNIGQETGSKLTETGNKLYETGSKLTETGSKLTETGSKLTETGSKEIPTEKEPNKRSVSFNRDVHVKRFGKPRESRSNSSEPTVRKEPFNHLSEQELIDEANKVIAQTSNITCTADHPPEKFFSLPHRKKFKEERDRRNSDDGTDKAKTPLGRSTSDVSQRKGKERTSLSTLFRRAQKNKASTPVVVTTKPVVVVKRSKSDVSDLKSNTNLNPQSKPIRKRSGSETEEFLKSLRNKKTQLSPIIESSPRDDYFKKTPPLELYQKQKLTQKESVKSDDTNSTIDIKEDSKKKVNPIEKPPRYKIPEKSEPKPPIRTKRGKSLEKDKESSPPLADNRKKTDIKQSLLVDEIDSKVKDINPVEVKERIKDSIRKLKENIYGDKEMIHSSQQPPDKPPLTRGHTVDHIVRILKEDQNTPPPKSHLISPPNGTNVNQPFSYIKPSISPDPNLFVRTTSPDRVPTPVNTMAEKGVVYAHVVREPGDTGSSNLGKQTVHKTYSPFREKYSNISDEDEGLGFEERHKFSTNRYGYDYKAENENFSSLEGPKITDSPIRPRFREYKLTSFEDFEPTYANEYPTAKDKNHDYIDTFRGRADGMDTMKKAFESENKNDLDFNELSHRRQLLESRINARKFDRERNPGEPVSRYLAETDPIYEAEKRMKATEKYVNETARYIRHTLERDGFAENNVTEDYNRYDSDSHKVKYNTESRAFQKVPKEEIDRREFIDTLEPRYKGSKLFPPEPEYEPPSLEFNTSKRVLTPDEYKEKKYKVKKHITSSQDVLHTNKYKVRDDWFGKRKGHYASNPEIAQEREDDYANITYNAKQAETYHNSLRRMKNKDKYKEEYGIRRHDSGDSRDYYREDRSPRRFDIDNRLVDSGIENDFRKGSSGEIHRKIRRHESDDDVMNTSLFLASERRHTEDNYPSEQIYVNGEYTARFKDYNDGYRKEYVRERSVDGGSNLNPKADRYEKSPDDKISAKPPKASKKLSGLEKVKQLFSRDSSKKSKKEKEAPKNRTRVLKSPEHLAENDSEYRRFTDPEPSDIDTKKKDYDREDRRSQSYRDLERRRSPEDRYKSSREDLNRHKSPSTDRYRGSKEDVDKSRDSDRSRGDSDKSRDGIRSRGSKEGLDRYKSSREDVRYRSSDPRNNDVERKYLETDFDGRFERAVKEDQFVERKVARKYLTPFGSNDRDSEPRGSDVESDRRRSRTAPRPMDSPALAERYRERRRLATPSPTPSPPPRPAPTSAGNWFKSLDRLARKKGKPAKDTKIEKESVLTAETEPRKNWTKNKPLDSPAKTLRFFGDTDQDSDVNTKQTVTKSKSHPTHSTLRKTTSNSSAGLDVVDHDLTGKSYSLTNLKDDNSPRSKYYKRNLANISERRERNRELSASETESQVDRRALKPPISPYDRSRSHSSSKTLKGSKSDLRRKERGSSSELRSSKQELRELKHRRRTPAPNSGESSTEGDSSHQSQRSVVYLHATTVGDIPDPGRITRNRSRDDVSSVNSSNLQVRSTTKSFSIFAPWTPRHYNETRDVHYDQRPRKPPGTFKKSSSTKNLTEERPNLQKNKSYSQTTLTRKPQSSRLSNSSTTLNRKPEKRTSSVQGTTPRKTVSRDKKCQSSEVLNRSDSERERISRSISMPKDGNKKAGWFKLSNKKKQENTRVR